MEYRMKRIFATIVVVLTLSVCFGMAISTEVQAAEEMTYVNSIIINQGDIVVSPGDKIQLSATVAPQNANNKTVQWSTSSYNAAIDNTGYLVVGNGVSTGTYFTVSCKAKDGSGQSTSIKVHVRHTAPKVTAAYDASSEAIIVEWDREYSVDKYYIYRSVNSNTNFKLYASTSSYSSEYSDTDVAIGSTYYYKIVAFNNNDIYTSKESKVVSVFAPVVCTGLDITYGGKKVTGTLNAIPGQKIQLGAVIYPTNATNKKVIWEVDSYSASISSTGLLTINNNSYLAGDTIEVTCTAADGSGVEATIKVYIQEAVTEVELNNSSLYLNLGETYTIKATCYPSNAVNKKVTFTSTNPKIATVDATGKITPKAAGSCTITAKSVNGVTASCKVTVNKPDIDTKKLVLYKGETYTIYPMYYSGKVTWKSSNTKIATVSSTGKVRAIKPGTVTITAKMGTATLTCKITVKKPQLALKKTSVTSGYKTKLYIWGTPKKVTWSSNNKKIATVDSKGNVKGIKNGTAKITANIDGTKYTCTVTVKSNIYSVTPSTNVFNHTYGKVALSTKKVYYSGNQLVYQCNILNNSSTTAVKFKYITLSVYANGELIASQKFNNYKLNIYPYDYKGFTFKFSKANTKKIKDVRSSYVDISYTYYYEYKY